VATLDPNCKAAKFLTALRANHPSDSKEELFERFSAAMKNDDALRKSVFEETFRGMCADLLANTSASGAIHPTH
jgi:hypothetical protein